MTLNQVQVPTEQAKGLKIEPRFTKGKPPFEGISWETRTASVKEDDGKVVFEMEGVRVPAFWSQRATNILASKYCRKAEVPLLRGGDAKGREHDAEWVTTRIALAIRTAGVKQGGYFASDEDAQNFQNELTWLLIHQHAAFNSPVLFNLGLAEAYGIRGDPAGCYYWSKDASGVVPAFDAYTHPQVSACFIRGVKDDLMHIADGVKEEMRIFKFGSGVGSNFSALRAEDEPLRNGGTSSGLMSWLEIYDRSAGAIKSGGTTRRAAKMVIVDADHPDVFKFVWWKAREEDKKRALIAAGYGKAGDVNSEAERTVGGQNANNSVRVTDEFMRKIKDDPSLDALWSTTLRTSGAVKETFPARKLWDEIVQAAWACADPGLQFHDNINQWHTCPVTAPIVGSNPCSEFMFLDDTSCNLASINLVHYSDKDGTFRVQDFMHAVRIIFLAQEILVDHASYPSAVVAENSHRFRPLGLGYANLGALLMRRGIPYDSNEARTLAAAITSLMTAHAYEVSADVAASKGAFDGFAENRADMLRVMKQHADANEAIPSVWGEEGYLGLINVAAVTWNKALEKGRKHGYRNAQATLLAPTGTIAFLMDCDTTGIEPEFALVKHKKFAGGGSATYANQSVRPALVTLGYGPIEIDAIVELIEKEGVIWKDGRPSVKPVHWSVFDCAVGSRSISPMGHVCTMAAVQPFLSGAISKTVNMPASSTVADVAAIYSEAWKRGLKAIAIYRDGCKTAQPLNDASAKKKDEEKAKAGAVPHPVRRKLPSKRRGSTYKLRVGGQSFYLRTGEYEDGTLGEIFVDLSKEGSTMRSLMNAFAVSVSLGLQHGVPLETFVARFAHTKFDPCGVVVGHDVVKMASSIPDVIVRILEADYLLDKDVLAVSKEVAIEVHASRVEPRKDGVERHSRGDAPFCPECGQLMRRTGNCHACEACGTSAGCG